MTERPCYQPQLPREMIHKLYEGSQTSGVPMTKYLHDIVEAHFSEEDELKRLEEVGIGSCRLDLPYELFERVQFLVAASGRTPREIFTSAIFEYLSAVEDNPLLLVRDDP